MSWSHASSLASFPSFLPSLLAPATLASFLFLGFLACSGLRGFHLPILQIFTPLPLRPQLVYSLLTGFLHQPSPITLTFPFSLQRLKLHSLPTCTEIAPALSWLVLPHPARCLVPSGIGHIAVSGRLGELELPLGGNLFSFCSVDGNHLQPPAGDRDPHGILCLQAHSATVTAEQVLP